jgi:membrane associated rhomboid family serine protease
MRRKERRHNAKAGINKIKNGMGSRDYFTEKKSWDKQYSTLIWLIIINLVIFAILNLLWITYLLTYSKAENPGLLFNDHVMYWFTLPSSLSEFGNKPWTLFTYMFSHYGVLQIISNMLWLWGFGFIFQDLAGNKQIIPVYIYGGLVGGIFFLLSGVLLNSNAPVIMLGGGTSIMCLAIATTTLAPGFRIFPMLNGGIPLWILTVLFVLFDISVAGASSSTAIAHIAAGLMGYIFVVMLRKGTDLGAWMNRLYSWVMDLFNPEKKYKAKESRLYYKAKEKPFVKRPNLTQKKLDEVLDKINQHGYDKLTEEEKEFLKKVSEQDLR